MQRAWKFLVGLGIILIVLAFNLDTTIAVGDGARVHNLGLQAKQQMLLSLGCALFIAGVILFGIVKTKEPTQLGQEGNRETAVSSKVSRAREKGFRELEDFLEVVNPAWDYVLSRLTFGMLLGLFWSYAASEVSGLIALPVFFLVAGVSLWRAPADVVILRMTIAHVVVATMLFVLLLLTKGDAQSMRNALTDVRFYLLIGIIFGLPAVVAFLLLLRIGRRTGRPAAALKESRLQ